MRRILAEVLGTYWLVFAGCGAIVMNDASGGAITHVGIALTFGLVVMTLIYTFGGISGAHFNPAVSLGLCVAGRFSFWWLGPYLLAQTAGAILASLTLRWLFREHPTLGATLPAGAASQSFVLEFLLTKFLMLTILLATRGKAEQVALAGIVIGGVIGLEAMFAGPICGASMNPARSLGPALVSGHLGSVWIYLCAPSLGALVGAVVGRIFNGAGEGNS
jgi:aquaporin Z